MPVKRLHLVFAALVTSILVLPASASAQAGRAAGIVRDTNGRPIRSAIVRAVNPVGHPAEITSTTDAKGRWAMIGLVSGEWRFTVEAEGFSPATAAVPVRVAGGPPLTFTLARELGPLPGALDKNIQQELTDAAALRDQGRFDQAIAAYEDIRSRNSKLTSVHLMLGDVYRQKAAQQRDAAARQTLLNQALSSYAEMLKSDADNDRAKAGVESTRAELATVNGTRP
jgi:hypothetical protein